MDEAQDAGLQAKVADGIRAGNLSGAMNAIENWRRAWFDLLAEPTQGTDRASERKPCRADKGIAEAAGWVPSPDPPVAAMFKETRLRLGWRDVEERSLTARLRKVMPSVAALWPAAPLTAAWVDWRLHMGPEHNGVLDEAWRTVLGLERCPWEEGKQ